MSSYKAPPGWTADRTFESWKAEIDLWFAVTDLNEKGATSASPHVDNGHVDNGLSEAGSREGAEFAGVECNRWFGQTSYVAQSHI